MNIIYKNSRNSEKMTEIYYNIIFLLLKIVFVEQAKINYILCYEKFSYFKYKFI